MMRFAHPPIVVAACRIAELHRRCCTGFRALVAIPPLLTALVATLLTAPLAAQAVDRALVAAFPWRSIGPANMGGRIVDIAGLPSPSHTFYVSAAGGGLFKTTNAGTTFHALLDTIPVASGGMIAIAPSDTNVVYYGTGEPNLRQSVSPGGGVWKTADGGRTWQFLGLEQTQHIGRVVVHPRDPQTVYVAAVGSPWGPNHHRGLYKTTDGGRTWKLIKFVNERAGIIDVVLDPRNPNVVWAASYEFRRTAWDHHSGGPGSALWKSADAGATWTEIKGHGFPETLKGRIGLAIAPSNPRVIYAIVEADTLPNPRADLTTKPQVSPSGLYRSIDGGRRWTKMNGRNERPFYYSQVRVSTRDPSRVYWLGVSGWSSYDGGKTVFQAMLGLHSDHHALWIDPADPRHLIAGNDGGLAQSWDDGGTWDYLNHLAIGQFYHVSYNLQRPYRVCGGLQDNGTWCGPSRRNGGRLTPAQWFQVGGGDGFVTAQSPEDSNLVYGESQGGEIELLHLGRGERLTVPVGDGLRSLPEAPFRRQWTAAMVGTNGDRRVATFQTAAVEAAQPDRTDRRNWNTPLLLSRHSPQALYIGTQRVLKLLRPGGTLAALSPDLTTQDSARIRANRAKGGITQDPSAAADNYGTITALVESPVRAGLLVAGTDDGNVWLTQNDGATWENLTGRFPGVPAQAYVSSIEPSHFDPAVFYVAFDHHRANDFRPYLYLTTDGGQTFTSIVNDLPATRRDYIYVVREDVENPRLLFVGTETGVYVSVDRGQHWSPFRTGLPTVSVRDLQIHPRDGELIAATHGRSLWIVDITPLQQLDSAVVAASHHLFAPKPGVEYLEPFRETEVQLGHRRFRAESPAKGVELVYWLAQDVEDVVLTVRNVAGDTLWVERSDGKAGLYRLRWHYASRRKVRPLTPAEVQDSLRLAQEREALLDAAERRGTIAADTLRRIRRAVAGGESLLPLVASLTRQRPREAPPPAIPSNPDRPGERPLVDPALEATPKKWTDGLAPAVAELFDGLSKLLQAGPRRSWEPGPSVGTGEYLATLSVDGREFRQTFRVERLGQMWPEAQKIGGEAEDLAMDNEQ